MRNEGDKERRRPTCGEVQGYEGMRGSLDKSRFKRIVCIDGDLLVVLEEFVAAFEMVFHTDWIFTRYQITGFCQADTFLQLGENKEAEGWENYANLLHFYEELNAELEKKQFKVLPVACSDEKHARILAYINAKLS